MSARPSSDEARPPQAQDQDPQQPHYDSDEGSSSSSEEESDAEGEEVISLKKRFEQIILGLRDKTISLRDKNSLSEFILRHGSYLHRVVNEDGDNNTLLHLLIYDAKDKVFDRYKLLLGYLIQPHPDNADLLKVTDNDGKTPLYRAIAKKRDKLVRFLCENHPNIDSVLSIACHLTNCLHVAITGNVPASLVVYLVGCASEKTLRSRDSNGCTPLHLAVDYARCTDSQLDVVKALIARCDKALDERTNTPLSYSPYRHHQSSREAKQKESTKSSKKTSQSKDTPVPEPGSAVAGRRPDLVNKPTTTSTLSSDVRAPARFGVSHKEEAKTPTEGPQSGFRFPQRVNTSADGGFGAKPSMMPPPFKSSKEPSPAEAPTSSSDKARSSKEAREKRRRAEKEALEPTEEAANAIRDYLKLHCLRTRTHDQAVDFLYGRNPEKQIYFDLYRSMSISEEGIEDGLNYLRFEDILQYVAIGSIRIEKRTSSLRAKKRPTKPDGIGRNDIIFLFNFLRNKGVKHIIRVIIDDTLDPPHSDESIEKAVGGFKVEKWDWRKFDLCAETIATAAPDAREVDLYWSGNNAVLRSWSEPGGLASLRKLERVNLHINQGLETSQRTQNNVQNFCRRFKALRPEVVVERQNEDQPEKQDAASLAADVPREQQPEERHRWLESMDEFADFIQNVDTPVPLREEVVVALIDDGIDINEQSLHKRILDGRSFCPRDMHQNLNQPYYSTTSGHGTVMASLICRICPNAKLYIIKLNEHVNDQCKRQITAKSAAKAILAAVDRKVHIISMSWTIERTPQNANDIRDLEVAVETAAKAGILMFCAANDSGIARDLSFPAACSGTKNIFKIGAAEASGTQWKWVGEPVDFILPGHNVVKERPNDAPLEKCKTLTGSSIATALAAGLAALVLYCVQLGALQSESQRQTLPAGTSVSMQDFEAMKGHERMKEAFLAIGTSPNSNHKYIEVWNYFEVAAKKADTITVKEKKIDVVAELAQSLKRRRTLE